ncbi:hypothetical protein VQ056_03030 [Paenibacillus sp. JTLBN-2024]
MIRPGHYLVQRSAVRRTLHPLPVFAGAGGQQNQTLPGQGRAVFYGCCRKTPEQRADHDEKIKRLAESVCAGLSEAVEGQVHDLVASFASGFSDIEWAKPASPIWS